MSNYVFTVKLAGVVKKRNNTTVSNCQDVCSLTRSYKILQDRTRIIIKYDA